MCELSDLHEAAQQAHYSKYKLISTTDTEQLITEQNINYCEERLQSFWLNQDVPAGALLASLALFIEVWIWRHL